MTLRLAALAAWFVIAAPIHLTALAVAGRSSWPRRFLAVAGDLMGLDVRVVGAPLRPHSLLIVNHVSWLDILALGGATGTAFVAKDNLGNGFIHWLADQNNTLYVRREDRRDSKAQAAAIAKALEGEQPIALFPEGTVGPGHQLLPFRSTLLEAAAYCGGEVEIRPVALDYGPDAAAIAWFQEPAASNICRVLGRLRPIRVTIRVLDPVSLDGGRKAIAARARASLNSALGFADEAPSPIGPSQ